MSEKTNGKERWVNVPIKSGRWIPQGEGEKLVGKYLEKEDATYMGRANWKYYFETDNPAANSDGVAFVYGTEAINEGMKDIPPGYRVKIEYKGEKKSNDPKKKPYKVFEGCAFISPEDALYKKWYPEDIQEDKEEMVPGTDDSQAQTWIKELCNEMRIKKVEVDPENIRIFAKNNQQQFELSNDDLNRIDMQLKRDQAKLEKKMQKGKLV